MRSRTKKIAKAITSKRELSLNCRNYDMMIGSIFACLAWQTGNESTARHKCFATVYFQMNSLLLIHKTELQWTVATRHAVYLMRTYKPMHRRGVAEHSGIGVAAGLTEAWDAEHPKLALSYLSHLNCCHRSHFKSISVMNQLGPSPAPRAEHAHVGQDAVLKVTQHGGVSIIIQQLCTFSFEHVVNAIAREHGCSFVCGRGSSSNGPRHEGGPSENTMA